LNIEIKDIEIKQLLYKYMDKDQLINIIKEWVKIDNDIRELHKIQALKKKEKKENTAQLMDIMKNNSIDVFDINDGQIIYKKKSAKKAINKKDLLVLLESFFDGDIDKAGKINSFILENREDKVTECIVRKSNNVKNVL
jgi:hypothetical protein